VQDFPRPALGDLTNVHRPSRKMPDNPTISFMQNDASFPSPSNLTLGYATDVPQSSNVPIESDHTDDVQNVTRSTLGDITNVDRNTYAMSGALLDGTTTRQKHVKKPTRTRHMKKRGR